MTRSAMAAALVGSCLLTASPRGQRPQAAPVTSDLVELDIVVLDRQDRPVTDLGREEFTIKEDGRAVDVKTFSAVAALGSMQPDDARVVTLLMDDIGVPITGTSAMQAIAPVVLSPTGPGDEVSVVRLSSRSDEAFGDVRTAHDRIDGYRGGMVGFSRRDTPETVLKAVAKISQQLEPLDHRRKVVLCLGLPAVCDVSEPALAGTSVLWTAWVAAVSAAARANVSVYCVDPRGVSRLSGTFGAGLVRLTGGQIFDNANNFEPAAEAIWREAGHYYLLGYWPSASTRELHAIDVKVARKGVHVRARQRR